MRLIEHRIFRGYRVDPPNHFLFVHYIEDSSTYFYMPQWMQASSCGKRAMISTLTEYVVTGEVA